MLIFVFVDTFVFLAWVDKKKKKERETVFLKKPEYFGFVCATFFFFFFFSLPRLFPLIDHLFTHVFHAKCFRRVTSAGRPAATAQFLLRRAQELLAGDTRVPGGGGGGLIEKSTLPPARLPQTGVSARHLRGSAVTRAAVKRPRSRRMDGR